MNENQRNERDCRYVIAWQNLSDQDKFRNLPALKTDYYINELICSMKDDQFKLFAHTAYAEEHPNLNQEIFITSLLCSLQSDEIKKQYIHTLQEEHSRSAVLGSMKDKEFVKEEMENLTDGAHQFYVRRRMEEIEK